MLVYLLLFVIALVSLFLRKKRYCTYLSWASLFFFSLFRGSDVGTDTSNAMEEETIMLRAGLAFDTHSVTMAGEYITNLIYLLILNGATNRLIIYFYSIVLFASLLIISKRFKIDLPIMMFFFLVCGWYMYSFNIARQMAATGIVAVAVSYIFESNFKKSLLFFLCIAVSVGIHFSSITCVLLYLFRWIKPKKFQPLLILLCFSTFLIFSGIFDFRVIMELFTRYYSTGYIETYYDTDILVQRTIISYMSSIFSFILSFIILSQMINNKIELKYITLFIFCIFMNLLRMNLGATISRSLMYFGVICLVFQSLYFSKNRSNKLLMIIFSAYHSLFFFLFGLTYQYHIDFNLF